MRMGPLAAIATVTIASLCAAGCGGGRHDKAPPQADNYAAQEPGANVTPTSDASFQLMGEDGPSRFEQLQQLIAARENQCSSVTKAVILGGLEGTDEWRVSCADSGTWLIWYRPDQDPELDHCTNPKCA